MEKGSYVTAANTELMIKKQKEEVEQDLEQAILKGRRLASVMKISKPCLS